MANDMQETKAHALYAPSSFPAWGNCVAYDSDGSRSQASDEGTLIHKQVELALNGGDMPDNPIANWIASAMKGLTAFAKGRVFTECRLDVAGLDDFFGTADAVWMDDSRTVHIADYKSFSDGSKSYLPQLEAYAYLILMGALTNAEDGLNDSVDMFSLHIIHGGSKTVETVDLSRDEVISDTEAILNARRRYLEDTDKAGAHHVIRINPWCRFCAHIGECKETTKAIEAVHHNNTSLFASLSDAKKLVVLDAVDKASEKIREQIRETAKNNGGVIEDTDGEGNVIIRYEIKDKKKSAKVKDIVELATNVCSPTIKDVGKKGEEIALDAKGLSRQEFLSLCKVSKRDAVVALAEKNPSIKKKVIDNFVSGFFESNGTTEVFVRTV